MFYLSELAAARGELRRLPAGLVWGNEDGEVRLQPDEAVTSTILWSSSALLSSARHAALRRSAHACPARHFAHGG
jgi:hypothetical protein